MIKIKRGWSLAEIIAELKTELPSPDKAPPYDQDRGVRLTYGGWVAVLEAIQRELEAVRGGKEKS